ncbi:MAG: ribose-phosphate diphosphokinase [Alphaproteobacteria bacterium]|nr:ribose-phosphate diphosphokinase [Alphaproteobacteria bacterium]
MAATVISYPGNERLARALADRLSLEVTLLETRHFPDDELYFRVEGDVKGKTVVVACTLDRPNEKIVGLQLLASLLRDLGAAKIMLVAPYLAYMRQDRAFHGGEGVSARYVARLLSAAFDGLATVDPHLHRIAALSDVYSIPTRLVHAAPAISDWIVRNVRSPLVIGPDGESAQWAEDIARRAACPAVVLEKERLGDRDVRVSLPNPDSLTGRTPVLVDDIISTARTMIAAIDHLRAMSAPTPICIGVHAIFAGDAYELLRTGGPARIVTCNTIEHETNGIDVRPQIRDTVAGLI